MPHTASNAGETLPSKAGGTLLLVDDEPNVCRGLRRILRQEGYRVLTAHSPEQAMSVLAEHAVDVVVSDQRMPGKKGTDFLSDVRAAYPDTVRMILSGAAEVQDVAEAMGKGVIYKYLTKPIEPALLRANVREAFSRATVLSAAERHESQIDTSTKLPTRRGMERIFATLLDAARGEGKSVCLLMLAVDQYDNVVSSYGSAFARRFLDCVAQRLSRVLEGDEFLGHDTAGMFLMLISAGDPAERIMFIDRQLDEFLSTPVQVDGQHGLAVTLSIGASVAEGRPSFDELVDQTHAAMVTGRERGGATIQLYLPRLVAEFRGQLELESELRQALAEKAFELYYQPQVDVSSGRIRGLEALVRWRHQKRGFISPALFIPMAERLGLIGELGSWVLITALRQFAAWQRVGAAPDEIAINVSAKQLKRLEFVEQVRAALEETGVHPMHLVLEITESAAIQESDSISSCLEALHGLGAVLAVDDFGTGYANIGNLTRFSFKKLKIDRSLLPRSSKDQRGTRLYTNIVAMATELDLTVVAEGVETPSELAAVHGAGCEIVQGYFYSPPLSVSDTSELFSGRKPLQDRVHE